MAIGRASPAAITGPFIAAAAAQGISPPVRLVDQDTRGWPIRFTGDPLLVDQYGDLWWCRLDRAGEARVTRAIWPEEFLAHADEIVRALARILGL